MKYYKALFSISVSPETEATQAEQITIAAKDVVCALAAEAGFEAFEEQGEQVCGYVQQQCYDAEKLSDLLRCFPIEGVRVEYTISEAADQNWNAEWERTGFEPIVIGDKCVVHDTIHCCSDLPKAAIDVTIDTHQAFGTGGHDTTKMIITELIGLNICGKSVLDCGCGTGILSIVAAKCGAKTVCAYDIDSWSVDNTNHNCELNGVKNISIMLGDSSVIPTLGCSFDVVMANINRNILLADMPCMCNAMSPGALLILSGFYSADAPLLCDKAAAFNLSCVKRTESNGWCMLVLQKQQP